MMGRRLSIPEAAERVGKSQDTIWRWIRQGLLQRRYGKVDEEDLLDTDQEIWKRLHSPRLSANSPVVRLDKDASQ